MSLAVKLVHIIGFRSCLAISLPILFPQALMSFLIVAPKIICREQFPLRLCRAQVKVHHLLRVVDCRVKLNVGGHPALPNCLIDELRLPCLIAGQHMGSINSSQEFLRGQFTGNISYVLANKLVFSTR